MNRIRAYALAGAGSVLVAFFLRQRRRPIMHPPPLAFLFENPLTETFVGTETLIERLDARPGMRILDAGCGPGRLTLPLAEVVGPAGGIVALDGQPAMLTKLDERLREYGATNVLPLLARLGEGELNEEGFDRAVLTMVLGEVRNRRAALQELHGSLKPGGILSVTEAFGDPDYRRPSTVRREVEGFGFRVVERFGGFPVYTLNFERIEAPTTSR